MSKHRDPKQHIHYGQDKHPQNGSFVEGLANHLHAPENAVFRGRFSTPFCGLVKLRLLEDKRLPHTILPVFGHALYAKLRTRSASIPVLLFFRLASPYEESISDPAVRHCGLH